MKAEYDEVIKDMELAIRCIKFCKGNCAENRDCKLYCCPFHYKNKKSKEVLEE